MFNRDFPSGSPSPRPIRVFVVDDHPVVLKGLKALIDEHDDLTWAGSAIDSHNLADEVGMAEADVVVLDISLPGPGMAATLQRLQEQCSRARTLLLTVHEEFEYVRHGMQAGAAGYVLKRTAAQELVQAIRIVASGGKYVDAAYERRPWERAVSNRSSSGATALSAREEQVLTWIAQGYSNKEIAERLQISVKTIDTYKMRSMRKLGLKSRADTVRYAQLHGWLNWPSTIQPLAQSTSASGAEETPR